MLKVNYDFSNDGIGIIGVKYGPVSLVLPDREPTDLDKRTVQAFIETALCNYSPVNPLEYE